MRRGLIAGAVAAGALACASASPPPGGAEDLAPPRLLTITPDSNAVNVRDRDVSFRFDETINDRGSGAQELDSHFLISPSDGAIRLSWHRSRIDVRPRDGFRPNTAYSVTLLPGLADLRGNIMRTGASVVFSTGPTIPAERITGVVFDWVAERPAPRALVQAVTPDSVMYVAQADSVGRFTVGPLPAGSYLVRAILDANGNRAQDRTEAFDTARVVTPRTEPVELRAVARDTLPPRILSVALADSLALRVTFDRFLDPDQPPALAAFRLQGTDSAEVPLVAVLTPAAERTEELARQQAAADSLRRADSLAGRPLPPRPTAPPAAERRTGANATPSIPAPYAAVLLRLAKPLAHATSYRLSVRDARALSGRRESSERTFVTPRAPAPPDTTRRAPPVRPAATPPPPASRP